MATLKQLIDANQKSVFDEVCVFVDSKGKIVTRPLPKISDQTPDEKLFRILLEYITKNGYVAKEDSNARVLVGIDIDKETWIGLDTTARIMKLNVTKGTVEIEYTQELRIVSSGGVILCFSHTTNSLGIPGAIKIKTEWSGQRRAEFIRILLDQPITV